MIRSNPVPVLLLAAVVWTAAAGSSLAQGDAATDVPADTTESAPPPAPLIYQAPTDLQATDAPNDAGNGIFLTWMPSPDDGKLLGYEILRVPSPGAPESDWIKVGVVGPGASSFTYEDDNETMHGEPNPKFVARDMPVSVVVRGYTMDGPATPVAGPVTATPRGNWFHTGKIAILTATLLYGFGVVFFIGMARGGRSFYIRQIPGLAAVDEAIGRATEMGKPILYVLGTGTASDIATIAGYTILARVARRTAEYQTPILVPVNDPVMLAMGQEVVREAYVSAGRPDVYRPENVNYVSAMQFPYVAAVNGLMIREKTAANFYMGVFHAESLLLAETGSVTRSIQISGTDQLSQIPFFVAATDYTLIGEELYAASAYLSQEPTQIGPLKAQDYFKVLVLVVILLGVLSQTFFPTEWILDLVRTQ